MRRRFLPALPFLLLLSGIFLTAPDKAHAQSISSVSSAKVTKGALAAEARVGYSTDGDSVSGSQDERLRTRLHLDYGVTDAYAFRLILRGDRRKNTGYEHESVEFMNRFALFTRESHGFDGGLRLSYTLKDGDKKPDSAGLVLVEVVPIQKWELRLNQSFSHDVGEGSEGGVSFESRIQATYAVSDRLRAGLDSFNNFGKVNDLSGYDAQAHALGPVVKYKMGRGYGIEAGYLAGVSSGSADHIFRLFFSRQF